MQLLTPHSLVLFNLSNIFTLYFPHVYQMVCATLMTENRQQVVSEKSHLMVGGLIEKNPALPQESRDSGV